METLYASLVLYEGIRRLPVGYHPERTSDAGLWCYLWYHTVHAVELFELPVTADAIWLIWGHCNVLSDDYQSLVPCTSPSILEILRKSPSEFITTRYLTSANSGDRIYVAHRDAGHWRNVIVEGDPHSRRDSWVVWPCQTLVYFHYWGKTYMNTFEIFTYHFVCLNEKRVDVIFICMGKGYFCTYTDSRTKAW